MISSSSNGWTKVKPWASASSRAGGARPHASAWAWWRAVHAPGDAGAGVLDGLQGHHGRSGYPATAEDTMAG
jgi:hypothetical protein